MSSALEATSGKTQVGQLDHNVAALLCYLPVMMVNLIASTVFLVTEPKDSKLVRFHAMQSLLTYVALVALSVVLLVVMVIGSVVLGMIDESLVLVATALASLAALVLTFAWLGVTILCLVKAYQGQIFRIPVIGQIADRMSG